MKNKLKISDIAILNQSSLQATESYDFINYLDTSSITKGVIENWQLLDNNFPSRAKRKIKKNSIVYSTVRPNQEHFGYFEEVKLKNCIVSTGFTVIDVVSNEVDSKFLYYLLTQKWVTNYLHTIAEISVSAYPSINPSELGNLEFSFPDLSIQVKISNILSSIDKKISINNQINDNLEALAKTIYDYWFVQFDFPDENGKPYKSSGGRMVYNEVLKREIPIDWEVKKLYEVSNITMGQSPSGGSLNKDQDGIFFFQGSTDFGWRYPANRVFTNAPTRFAKENDILLSVRAPIGAINLSFSKCCIGRGLAALNSKQGFSSFLLYQMNYFKKKFDLLNSVGTTFGSLTKDELHNLVLAYPSIDILAMFEKKVSILDIKVKNNSIQNQQLTQLRDWLLPMLMNGQVAVK